MQGPPVLINVTVLMLYMCFSKNWAGEILGDLLYQSNALSTSFLWFRFSSCILKYIIEMMLTIVMGPHSNLDFYMVKELPKMLINTVEMCFFVTSTKFKILLYMAELLRPLSFYLNFNENPFTDGSSPCFRYSCLLLVQYVQQLWNFTRSKNRGHAWI